ncbi:MAG: Septum site-determining protein MinC [uncultured Thermomicrobiales bacterium]|uniref:Probable septum site-determining protein MinC n=1 Tax=uncultured Thermomicrobiales bacterium TaxID=1645740 RepID=A0A6J4VUZ1_9BACT|nr:MAG: Septum site-determining protein MinC [uncultured Thermomicrobiales bacterium]
MAQNVQAYVHDPPLLARGRFADGAVAMIKVRGTREGLLLTVPDDARLHSSREVAAALAAHLDDAEAFFSGADIIVDLGERDLDEGEIAFYRQVLEERGVVVRGFTAASPQGRAAIRKAGYHPLQVAPPERTTLGDGAAATPAAQIRPVNPEIEEARYLRRTLRSGARIRHHGNLVLLGDINAGAEVAAAGDIIVWGTIRGMVHAGALGDDSAIICALGLNPTQLRIGSHYALPPSEKKGTIPGTPERVRLENGRLVVEPWKMK